MMCRPTLLLFVIAVGSMILPTTSHSVSAQEKASATATEDDGAAKSGAAEPTKGSKEGATEKAKQREEKLAQYLSGARFVGKFTVEGKEDSEPKTEEYVISKCEKLPQKDLYRLTARIKYGDVDNEVPLDLKILWSGTTPVMTLDSVWIPGMGTFGARVLIHRGRYAGTWQHDDKGGHLFGLIKKDEE